MSDWETRADTRRISGVIFSPLPCLKNLFAKKVLKSGLESRLMSRGIRFAKTGHMFLEERSFRERGLRKNTRDILRSALSFFSLKILSVSAMFLDLRLCGRCFLRPGWWGMILRLQILSLCKRRHIRSLRTRLL